MKFLQKVSMMCINKKITFYVHLLWALRVILMVANKSQKTILRFF